MASRDPEKGVMAPRSEKATDDDVHNAHELQDGAHGASSKPSSESTTLHSLSPESQSHQLPQQQDISGDEKLDNPDVNANKEPNKAHEQQFLVDWDGPDDPMNPKNKSLARKWVIVIIIAIGSYCVTNTSSLYTTTYEGMNAEFGSSRIVATLGLTSFVFGLGLAPMILGPLSEFYGRRPIYIIAYAGFVIWLIPCAVAQNIQTMIIVRFFDGLCGSAFLSVAGGTVGEWYS